MCYEFNHGLILSFSLLIGKFLSISILWSSFVTFMLYYWNRHQCMYGCVMYLQFKSIKIELSLGTVRLVFEARHTSSVNKLDRFKLTNLNSFRAKPCGATK